MSLHLQGATRATGRVPGLCGERLTCRAVLRVRHLLGTVLLVGALTATCALAATPVLTDVYDGATKHGRFTVNVIPQCFTGGCKRATQVAIQLSPRHPTRKCPSQAFQISTKLNHGQFSGRGHFELGGKTVTFTATGDFTKPNAVKGKITIPKPCGGGSDTYSITGIPE